MKETNFNRAGSLICDSVTKTITVTERRNGFVSQCVAVELLATIFTVSG